MPHESVDLLIHSAGQLLTIAGPGPRRGPALRELGLIADGALAISAGVIVAAGPTAELRRRYVGRRELDAGGRVVMPGFVDPHTHLIFAGSREEEFELRLAGASYMEIMRAGGGIMSTVRRTRAASAEELADAALPRLRRMLAHGVTTAESKTGYGLTAADELKLFAAMDLLGARQPVELIPTFLGAHATPAEYAGRTDAYTDLVSEAMLPAVAARFAGRRLPFCDVFCEEGAFDLAQSRRILTRAAGLGFPLKLHVDEFKALGGTRLAVELGAVSADHLVCTPAEEIARLAASQTIAVSLPGTPFGLGLRDYSPARALIDAGGALALASDLNPGTCYCESMPFSIALACRAMRLLPAEAIVAATLNAACAIGCGERLGSLEAGKQADILILDAPNYQQLAYRFGTNPVALVIKRGEIVWQS
jgi:imidazolonepropionase